MPATAVEVWTTRALGPMTEDLRALVGLETPSEDKELLDAGLSGIRRWLTRRLGEPAESHRHDGGEHGDVLEVLYAGEVPGEVLFLCHYDTVWPAGTLADWPFEVVDGKASGPGAFDMKSGIVQAVWSVRCARALGLPLPAVRFLLTGDEEVGSPAGRAHIERLSAGVRATLVLEASLDGAVKTGRKGVGLFDVVVHGVEAHAGLEPDAGASAIHELAMLIPEIAALGDKARGTTVNAGLISGGTARNVVAGQAWCALDVRVASVAEMRRVDAALARLRPSDPRARVTLRGEWNRPPMVPNPPSQRLFKLAHQVAAQLGFALGEVSVGGASDANLVSALGRPVLDGLGALGGGAHARHEHVLLEHLPRRTALLTNLLVALGT